MPKKPTEKPCKFGYKKCADCDPQPTKKPKLDAEEVRVVAKALYCFEHDAKRAILALDAFRKKRDKEKK